jgi:hypothetical protein
VHLAVALIDFALRLEPFKHNFVFRVECVEHLLIVEVSGGREDALKTASSHVLTICFVEVENGLIAGTGHAYLARWFLAVVSTVVFDAAREICGNVHEV